MLEGKGMTTKSPALTNMLGNLVRFVLLPGHRFGMVGVPPLIDGVCFNPPTRSVRAQMSSSERGKVDIIQ